MSKNQGLPPKAAKVLGVPPGKVAPKAAKVLGVNPPKAEKVLGMNAAKKPTGIASAAKSLVKGVGKSPAPKPTAFKTADPKTSGKMKPGAPIIGANRGPGANSATVNKERMQGTIKKLGF